LERNSGANLSPDIAVPSEPRAGVVAVAKMIRIPIGKLLRHAVLSYDFTVFSVSFSCRSLRLAGAEDCERLTLNRGRASMDWNRVEGNWKQVKGKVKEQWGKLSDDDLTTINGRRDQLEGKIQERYGYQKDQVRKDVDDWYNRQTW
jgi:uncharacterized protein YjbJ (UPF0337 family)